MIGGITEDHKQRWLLIQVAPVTLLGEDIFLAFTKLAIPSCDYLRGAIRVESLTIQGLLLQPSTLVCVLDEAQALIKDSDYFQSDTEPTQGRPVLRPIVKEWGLMLPNLIVSGTAISMLETRNFMGYGVAKEGGYLKPVTDIGGFDDEDGRRAYLKSYLPPGFLDKPEGKEIASRVGYWLRGRFVFNAAV
jgi:hypothetical protein